MKLSLAWQLYENMGPRYIVYRVRHEIEKKIGFLKKRHPKKLQLQKAVSKSEWKNNKTHFVIEAKENRSIAKKPTAQLKKKAERFLNGELQYFNAEWIKIGKNYNWLINPSNGFQYDISKHWSEIPDLSVEAGDIKFVWEKSRFSYLLTLIRYDYHFENDLSEFIFSEIESWIDSNPINQGPNWRCSQEISLRIFNWCYAIYYYQNSDAFTEERWSKIQNVIYASLHHVYHHIDFSRIAVRNNHAITETLFLALSEVLFPFISETKEWSKKGRHWFEEEISYQIYDDGTFLQFSMNYHRVVIQLLTLGISVAEKAGNPFSQEVNEKAYKSIDFLFQCLQKENGWLPNYGSNDGALFFQWSDTDYRDYRPQLNSLHYLLTGQDLFSDMKFSEEKNWWGLIPTNRYKFEKLQFIEGIQEYPVGGYVLIRDLETFTFLRCGSHKDRPAQADNLHIDIWVKGENVFRDSGTYQYNTKEELVNYFTGTHSHNSVIVDNKSQMQKGSRFIWYYWTQKIKSKIFEDDKGFHFEGSIKAYQFLNKNGVHSRKVTKKRHENIWVIEDSIEGLDLFKKQQIWHFGSNKHEIQAFENGVEIAGKAIISNNSNYYGVIESGSGIGFEFSNKIQTFINIP